MSRSFFRPYLWFVRIVSLIVPGRFRIGWRREWEAELRQREFRLAKWRQLNLKAKIDLMRRSFGSFRDAIWMQPRRLEDQMFQDIQFAVRMLVKKPSFTIIAVSALALGIGANSAIFSVVNGVLLRPLGFKDQSRLVKLWENWSGFDKGSVSYPNFKDWRDQNRTFESMAAYRWANLNLTGEGQAERIAGQQVSAEFFSVLGVSPTQGRDFVREDDVQGANQVAIISDELWERKFARDHSVIGRTVLLSDLPTTIIGVLPAGFQLSPGVDIYVPIDTKKDLTIESRAFHPGIQVIARLKPGVNIAQSQADLAAVAQGLSERFEDTNRNHSVTIGLLYDDIVGPARGLLMILLSAVAFVLLIACANVANLMLVRAAARQKELAVRSALGASRARLVRQLVTESVLLSVLGGVCGLLIAYWGTGFAIKALPDVLPRSAEIRTDTNVLLFTLLTSVLTGILFGLAPGLQASRPDLTSTLKEGSRGSTSSKHRIRSLLVVAEIALALVLLVGAGLLIRSFMSLNRVNPGFDPSNSVSMQISLSPVAYAKGSRTRNLCNELPKRIMNLPGVEGAAFTTLVPLDGVDSEVPFFVSGQPVGSLSELPLAMNYITTPRFLQTLRIPLLKGRYFDDHDGVDSTKVAVIDQNLARDYFADQDPIGKHITIQGGKDISIEMEIVGVVGHIKQQNLDTEGGSAVQGQIHFPMTQLPDQFISLFTELQMVVRTASEPLSFVPFIRNEINAAAPNQPVQNIKTMDDVISGSISNRRFVLILLGVFSGLALILASVGVYGVMSFTVAQRTHEIGIRMALGASRGQVMYMVLATGGRLALAGIGIGAAGALVLTRFISSLLFNVSPADPLTFIAISLFLASVALFATYVPARRAMKVDPMKALRYE